MRTGVALLMLAAAAVGAADTAVEVPRFSAALPDAEPEGWQPLTFQSGRQSTVYRLVADDGITVLRADADASASGLVHKLEVDARTYPILAWRWKVGNLIEKSDATRKEGDDYPARVYVMFKYDPERVSAADRAKYELARLVRDEYPPHAGINYVWDNRLPPGTILPNAYIDRVKMIVLRSGAAEVGRWVEEERNVYEDYKRAFGEEPPPISGVAVMTDTDDTGDRATAWYGDIVLRKP